MFQAFPQRRRNRRARRRGMGIIPVIAVFAVALTICALWTRSSLAQHRDQLLREERTQATWLAEAGVRRAAARRVQDAAYAGETWDVPGEQIVRVAPDAVVITVTPADDSEALRITARVSYPREKSRVSVSKTVHFKPRTLESTP